MTRKATILFIVLCLATVTYIGFAQNLTDYQSPIDNQTIQTGFPNVFRPIENLIRRIIGKPRRTFARNYLADVTNLVLSRNEVPASCLIYQAFCNSKSGIGIYTVAVDPDKDVLIYDYTVSGGKVIGQGDKVVWDLAGEKPGVYKITAGVDDSSGVCGQTLTKTATVIE